MAIDLSIDGKPRWSLIDYSVTEDATPIDPSDMSGGIGQMTIGLPHEGGSARGLRNKVIELKDGSKGSTWGYISSTSGEYNEDVTITADSRLIALNAARTAAPFAGKLSAAFRYYLGLVSVTTDVLIDSAVVDADVVIPGWTDNVWDMMKRFAAAYQLEVTLVSNMVVLRPVRQRTAVSYRDSASSWSMDNSRLAQSVEIMYYQSENKVEGLAYPLGGWNSSVPIYQVDEAETVQMQIQLSVTGDSLGPGATLTSVQQPVPVDSVTQEYAGASVYSVIDKDGKPVSAEDWVAGGGFMSVTLDPVLEQLTVTLRGPAGINNAPFRIATQINEDDSRSSLRIVGTGVFYNKQKVSLATGLDIDKAPELVGVVVDSPFINTRDDAYRAGAWTLATYTGPNLKMQVASSGINRVGDTGNYRYPTIAEFNAENAGPISAFNTQWAGQDISAFDAVQFEKVSSKFENQAFGNIAGARVQSDDAWYRIRSATTTPAGISYDMELDTTVKDFNTVWYNKTIADFNAQWDATTLSEYNSAPLARN